MNKNINLFSSSNKLAKSALLVGSLLSAPYAFSEQSSHLVYCSEGSPDSFNPQRTLSGTARNATAGTIYNRLLDFKSGTTEVAPSLATEWTISDDRTVYRFKLRNGVKFQETEYFTPTRNFNADDVLFSINRQLDPHHPYHNVGGGSYQYFQGMGMSNLIKDMVKINDHEIEIHLAQPESPFLANLAMPFMSILSAEYAEQLQKQARMDQIDVKPIGTGPFAYKRYMKDSMIRYVAHQNYWKGPAKVDNLIFAVTPDSSVRYQKMKKNECHLAVYPSPSDLNAIRADSNLELEEIDGLNIGYLAMNTEKPPFNNQLVRKAIAHALNKDAYIDAIYMGNAIRAKNPYPPTMWSYNDNVTTYDYNPEKAKALLSQAGYPNGFDTSIWTLPVNRPYNPNGRKMGEMMQQDLAKIGIKVSLTSYDWGTYLEKVKQGEHEMVQLGWTGDNGDPDNFLYTLFSCDAVEKGSNNARYCQQTFDKLISQARIESDPSVRSDMYQQALDVFSRDVPIVPIAHAKVFRIRSELIGGYVMDPFDMDSFYDISFK